MRLLPVSVIIITLLVLITADVSSAYQSVNACSGSSNLQAGALVPPGWRRINVDRKFTFYLPPNMRQGNMSGVESLLREYSNGRMRLFFVYEPYSFLAYDARRAGDKRDFRETTIRIASRRATVITYYNEEAGHRTYSAEMYVGDWPNGRVDLFMSASSPDSADLEIAKCVFRSLRFSSTRSTRRRWLR